MDEIVAYLRAARDRLVAAGEPADPLVALRERRERAEALPLLFPPPDDVTVEEVSAGGVPAELLSFPGAAADRALLYLHGGAYVAYSPRSHRELAARLGRASGCPVLVPEYRLAPEHPHPAALVDAAAAYGWLLEQRDLDADHVSVAGDSAGGGLALVLTVALRDAGQALPSALALLSPWTDLTMSSPSVRTVEDDVLLDEERLARSARMYAGALALSAPELSPIFADLTALPPMHIEVGGAELLLDDSVRLAEAATAAGVPVALEIARDLPHVFPMFATTPEARSSTDRIGAFLRAHLA